MWQGALRGPDVQAPTLASVVARRLEDEVVAAGWPVGRVLGSEGDLLDRFGVSRAVLREAVRIVEHTGAARMRRGPGGGLVVTEPSRDAVVSASNVWFSYIGATMAEMEEVRTPLYLAAARLAATRATPEAGAALVARAEKLAARDRVSLRDLAAVEHAVATMTANPSLALFFDALGDLGVNRLRSGWAEIEPAFTPTELDEHVRGYVSLARAVAAGRPDDAEAAVVALQSAVLPRVRNRRQPERRLPPHSSSKLAEQVAAAIRDDVERAGWPVGSVVGSEADLIERHGVSRAILREAVRILEHHGAVRTKRGPHGGLVVTAPDSSAIRRATRLFLEYEGVTAEGLSETRTIVEVASTRLAAERIGPESAANLRAVLDGEGTRGQVAVTFVDLHEQIAACTGNRLLVLFVEILADLVPPHYRADQRTPSGMAAMSEGAHHAHARIVEAVVAGDAEAATRRMRRHLEAGSGVLQ
jgi:DNA-binding FadR family transcriptional regulator